MNCSRPPHPRPPGSKIERIEQAQSERAQLQAAADLLDRAGYSKTQHLEVHHFHELLQRFTSDELEVYGNGGPPPKRFWDVFDALEGPKDAG